MCFYVSVGARIPRAPPRPRVRAPRVLLHSSGRTRSTRSSGAAGAPTLCVPLQPWVHPPRTLLRSCGCMPHARFSTAAADPTPHSPLQLRLQRRAPARLWALPTSTIPRDCECTLLLHSCARSHPARFSTAVGDPTLLAPPQLWVRASTFPGCPHAKPISLAACACATRALPCLYVPPALPPQPRPRISRGRSSDARGRTPTLRAPPWRRAPPTRSHAAAGAPAPREPPPHSRFTPRPSGASPSPHRLGGWWTPRCRRGRARQGRAEPGKARQDRARAGTAARRLPPPFKSRGGSGAGPTRRPRGRAVPLINMKAAAAAANG